MASELSALLGGVYREDEPSPAPAPVAASAHRGRGLLPDWADESVLDAAFADWVPGPPADAPSAERSMLTELAAAAPDAPPVVVPDAEPAAAATPAPAPAAKHPPAPPPLAVEALLPRPPGEVAPARRAEPARPWQRGDDDILPAGGLIRRRRNGRRR
ncbi:MAG TPA: hypothetical protein VGB14_08605 [Acidimicrobiales bacterium]|jgi:hypothetical protein